MIRPVIHRWLTRPIAGPEWDVMLRGCGAVALVAIACTSFVPPAADFALLFTLTVLAKGPYSLVVPLAYEPVVMLFARLHAPLIVAVTATTACLAVECVNYRVYRAALHSRLLAGVRRSAFAERTARWFGVAPFATVWLAAFAPLPYGVARVCAVLAGYPVNRYLAATLLGRFPRYWLYGTLGLVLPISDLSLGAIGLATAVVGLLVVRPRKPPQPSLAQSSA